MRQVAQSNERVFTPPPRGPGYARTVEGAVEINRMKQCAAMTARCRTLDSTLGRAGMKKPPLGGFFMPSW